MYGTISEIRRFDGSTALSACAEAGRQSRALGQSVSLPALVAASGGARSWRDQLRVPSFHSSSSRYKAWNPCDPRWKSYWAVCPVRRLADRATLRHSGSALGCRDQKKFPLLILAARFVALPG